MNHQFRVKEMTSFIGMVMIVFNALAEDSPASINASASSKEWLSGKYYERLGDPNQNPIDRIVYAPTNVVEAASRVLSGASSTWRVYHNASFTAFHSANFSQRNSDIVEISDDKGNSLVYLIRPDRWIRLNTPNALSAINFVLADNFEPLKTLDGIQWSEYILDLSILYRGGLRRAVLSQKFWKEAEPNIKSYLGNEKDPNVLRALCADPVIAKRNGDFSVSSNLITNLGGVEHWTIFFRFDKSIQITKIDVGQIYPNGTFVYAEAD